ncbi:MAG: hypothetical protein QG612_106 [Pseudomonadota bacterium]|nr:hypothetical protein [Pseudomonadota bacterium]
MLRHAARPVALPIVPLLPLLLLLLLVPTARAELSPWTLSFSQALARNSNVFYATDERAVGDTIASTGVRLGLDQPVGRQRLGASLGASHNRYRQLGHLDFTDHALDLRLDLETAERLSGTVTLQSARSLPRDQNDLSLGERNLLTSRALGATARLGLVTAWTLEAGAASSQSRYSAAAYRGSNADQASVQIGLRVRPSSALMLGGGLRRGQVDLVDVGTRIDRDDLDLLATLAPGGASSFDARISLTREAYRYATGLGRDGQVWTGGFGWSWRPTGKLTTRMRLNRDTSNARFDHASSLLQARTDQALRTTSLQLGANWQATAKLNVDLGLTRARRLLEQGLIAGSDETTALSLNARHALRHSIDLGCGMTWSRRTVSYAPGQALSQPFRQTLYSCSGQIRLN